MSTHAVADTGYLLGRSLRHITRSLDTIITTTLMPIAFMLLFVYVFGGAINTGTEPYVNYLLPGILLITIATGTSYTAFRLFLDLQSGMFERFQSMPITRSSALWAHALTSLAANLVSVVIVVLAALIMGFRSAAGVLAWLAVAAILTLFTLALTWLAVVAGLSAKTADGAVAYSYPLILLPFISSAFVPTDTMPAPVAAFAEHQPVTAIVDTIRNLLTQQPVSTSLWTALAWCVGILVVAYAAAMVIYRRKISEGGVRRSVRSTVTLRVRSATIRILTDNGRVPPNVLRKVVTEAPTSRRRRRLLPLRSRGPGDRVRPACVTLASDVDGCHVSWSVAKWAAPLTPLASPQSGSESRLNGLFEAHFIGDQDTVIETIHHPASRRQSQGFCPMLAGRSFVLANCMSCR